VQLSVDALEMIFGWIALGERHSHGSDGALHLSGLLVGDVVRWVQPFLQHAQANMHGGYVCLDGFHDPGGGVHAPNERDLLLGHALHRPRLLDNLLKLADRQRALTISW
jgi:hypothetical protein